MRSFLPRRCNRGLIKAWRLCRGKQRVVTYALKRIEIGKYANRFVGTWPRHVFVWNATIFSSIRRNGIFVRDASHQLMHSCKSHTRLSAVQCGGQSRALRRRAPPLFNHVNESIPYYFKICKNLLFFCAQWMHFPRENNSKIARIMHFPRENNSKIARIMHFPRENNSKIARIMQLYVMF